MGEEEPKLAKGVLWERNYNKCPLCHSEKRVSQVIREEMGAKGSELNQLQGGFIPYSIQQPCEIIPLEKMQLVIPIKLLARFWDECEPCGYMYVVRLVVTVGMGIAQGQSPPPNLKG